MLKKLSILYFILLSNILLAFQANAGFFDGMSNPCNWGGGERVEWWGDQRMPRGPENALCPPYNKGGGRNDNTCLVQANSKYPGAFSAYVQNLCAEESPESNYFEPKIRVRDQECNGAFCWTTDHTLNWDGECTTLAGPYGLPLTRMCARVALPVDPIRNMPADLGYTYKQHLDTKGEFIKDEPILDGEGRPLDVDPPKLCAYLDPAFMGVGEDGFDIDLFDLNPYGQSFHKTSKLHPIIRILIFFLDMMASAASSVPDMMAGLANMLGGGGDGFFKVIGSLFEGISWLIKGFFELIKKALEAIGQINRVVSGYKYGCVKIPLAPFPPPFCETIQPFYQPAVVQKICETNKDRTIEKPSLYNKCVNSELRNNFIHNAVRVGYEYFVPLCKEGVDPMKTDICVNIRHIKGHSAESMHALVTGGSDLLKLCSEVSGDEPCIEASVCSGAVSEDDPCIPYSCSISEHGCNNGIRLVYGVRNKNIITPMNYYRDSSDLESCKNGVDVMCQEVWGVNMAEFADVALVFPKNDSESSSGSDANDLTPLVTTLSLRDNNGKTNSYNATIFKSDNYNKDLQYTQSPKDICVSRGKVLSGCVPRAKFSRPTVYDCSTNHDGLNCVSTNLKPQMIVSAAIGEDSISSVANVKTIYDSDYDPSNPLPTDSMINIAGYNFNVFATDDDDHKKPFRTFTTSIPSDALNPTSRFGLYKNNVSPVSSDGSPNKNAVYLKEVEYKNGRYIRGGTAVCVEALDQEKCPVDTTDCVLTSIKNSDQVSCKLFQSKIISYPNMVICESGLDSSWKVVDSIPKKSGGVMNIMSKSVTLANCSGTAQECSSQVYCYASPNNAPLCETSYLPEERVKPEASHGKILSDDDYYDINYSIAPNVASSDTSNTASSSSTSSSADTNQSLSGQAGEDYVNNASNVYKQPSSNLLDSNQSLSGKAADDYIKNARDQAQQNSGMSYKKDLQVLRSKTSYEMNLCIDLKRFYCEETTEANATWPRTESGEEAQGTCKPGFVPNGKPLKRYCVPNSNLDGASFDKLDSGVGCK